jgi:hypothetical protein
VKTIDFFPPWTFPRLSFVFGFPSPLAVFREDVYTSMAGGGIATYSCSPQSSRRESRCGEDGAKPHRFPRDGSHIPYAHPQVTKRMRQGDEGNCEEMAMSLSVRRYKSCCRDDTLPWIPRPDQARPKPKVGETAQVWTPGNKVFVGIVEKIEKGTKHTYYFVDVELAKSKRTVLIAPQWAVYYKC